MPVNAQQIQGPKLRLSCDACNLAKVRCSKARPSCARCQSHILQCNYSMSMRSGKYPARRNKIPKQLPVSQRSKDTSHQGAVFEGSSPSLLEKKSAFFDHSAPSLVDTVPLSDVWPNIFRDIHSTQNDLESLMSVDGLPYQSYPEFYGVDIFLGNQSSPSWSDTQSIPKSMCSTEPQTPSIPLVTPITSETPSAILSRAPQPQRKATAASSCFCNQRILSQLFELSRGSSASPAFDVALSQNKAVISLCLDILNNHTCSQRDASYVLTFAALIARIIGVYESIYPKHHQSAPSSASSMRSRSNTRSGDDGASLFVLESNDSKSRCSSANPSNRESHWSTSYPSTVSLPSMIAGKTAITPVRFTLGAYEVDHKDEEMMKRGIFKIELSKVDNLIRAFGQRFAGNSSQPQYEAKFTEDMVSFLQKRLWNSLEMLRGLER